MEDLYSIHPGIARATIVASGEVSAGCGGEMRFDEGETAASGCRVLETDLIKARIASHPRYSSLLSTYIECRKVGAPPEMETLLEEIAREGSTGSCSGGSAGGGEVAEIGADPELDEFMDSYCRVLVMYKDELSKPFDEAVSFLANIESQLRNLCKVSTAASSSSSSAASSTAAADTGGITFDEAPGSSEEEPSYENADALETQDSHRSELKEMLFKKYSGYLSNLRKEFSKKKKKGKLPIEARLALLDWWDGHYKWPYPTEDEKAKLAELTGLDQKQINNWFINQRKRHWKPSEDMQLAIMEGLSAGTTLCFKTGTIGPS